MIRIRFFSSFGNPRDVPAVYERVHLLKNLPDSMYEKEYIFTNEDDYTHAILLNTAMPTDLKISKENVIGLAFEPPPFLGLTHSFLDYAKKYIGTYYIGHSREIGLTEPFEERFGCMWNATPPKLEDIPSSPKPKWMSIMISNKISAPGHKYRHQLVMEILKTDLPIDIYGRGCQYYDSVSDSRLKGEFTETEPYLEYDYHIAIENFKTSHYFSEKIVNSLICGATPIYWGATSIEEYFGNQSVILLKGNVLEDIVLLQELYHRRELGEIPFKLHQYELLNRIGLDRLIQERFLHKNCKS
jgi:hypothetical protein